MNKSVKGQASMEFLMVYGWAILAAVVAVGVLAYYGVFNPGQSLPSLCYVDAPFGCSEFEVGQDGVRMFLINGAGTSVDISDVSVPGCGSIIGPTGLNDGDKTEIYIPCSPGNTGDKFTGNIKITYKSSGKQIEKVVSGEIKSDVRISTGASAGPTCSDGVDTQLCSNQVGVCSGSFETCAVGGVWAGCGAAEYGGSYEATETMCDGLDNDCDGSVDEDPGCSAPSEPVITGGIVEGVVAEEPYVAYLPEGTNFGWFNITTSSPANCKWDNNPGIDYGSMSSNFFSTGGTEHGQWFSTGDGVTTKKFIKCQDVSTFENNTLDYNITYSIARIVIYPIVDGLHDTQVILWSGGGFGNTPTTPTMGLGEAGGFIAASYLRFDLTNVPANSNITSAVLSIIPSDSNAAILNTDVELLSGDSFWDGSNAFNSSNYADSLDLEAIPGTGDLINWDVPSFTAGVLVTLDVSSLVDARVSDGLYSPGDPMGIRFGKNATADIGNSRNIYSFDQGSNIPTLNISYYAPVP